jgi:hypothetical protein
MSLPDIVELLSDWPQPGTGNDGPVIRYGRGPLMLAYDTSDKRVAVATIPLCLKLICGQPNDEVLRGHPLFDNGLKFYSVHRVNDSSLLATMERINSVHDRHDSATYLQNKEHWVFTFQDETVEFVALVLDGKRPSFIVCASWLDANALLARSEA